MALPIFRNIKIPFIQLF